MNRVFCIVGTRPEAIKMAPVIRRFAAFPDRAECVVCSTGQHRQMLDQVFSAFRIQANIDLDLMQPNQTLGSLNARAMEALNRVLGNLAPDLVLVQGDTTTAMVGALAGYYHRIPVGHVEAGLRTQDPYSPFPEEINRRIISVLAALHFAPTQTAVDVLLREGYHAKSIYLTGNTAVDALLMTCEENRRSGRGNRPVAPRRILVTAHRRENFDGPLRSICTALAEIARRNDEVEIVYPVHPNPNVWKPVHESLSNRERIRLVEPMNYVDFVRVLDESYLVLTDSGGIQEEAPALGKPVLVMRETTERPESVTAGVAKLVGTDSRKIVSATETLLRDPAAYARMAHAVSPYGDGRAADRIVGIILNLGATDSDTDDRRLADEKSHGVLVGGAPLLP
jgi:UDP-N-acetylglucosamine 2-epimerase